MPLILHDVGHGFAGVPTLFDGLDHRFEPGRVCAITGPSGSGKSTLLGIAAGMISPRIGAVERVGLDRTCWVLQNPTGSARRTAVDHVALPVLARGSTRAAATRRAHELLVEFRLEHRVHARFAELSGGEAQRLMLARAVAAEPDLLLVDEPTAQLDRPTARLVSAVIGVLARHGAVALVATHDAETVSACDDVLDLGAWRPCD